MAPLVAQHIGLGIRVELFAIVAEVPLSSGQLAADISSHESLVDFLGAQISVEDLKESVLAPRDYFRDLLRRLLRNTWEVCSPIFSYIFADRPAKKLGLTGRIHNRRQHRINRKVVEHDALGVMSVADRVRHVKARQHEFVVSDASVGTRVV